ncbi:MAG TPA: hypothetical protein VMH05_26145 [Bryobacteraceae bacterium]|nr:hypothetical protein [Bryobacteraceae bacterium]
MDDPRHVGGEAYRILVPAGWRIEGSVMWKNGASDPAAPWVRLIGPARQEIGILPPTTFVWNPQFGPRYHPGSFINGAEVQPLLDPVQCIKTIIIPRYLRNLDNADLVSQQPLPELAQAGRLKYPQPAYQNAAFQAGKMRFEYVENGVTMQEDVYVLTAAVQIRSGQTATTLWEPDEIRYSKAPKGTLDAQLPLFETAMFSLRPNLPWWARVQEVSEELARLQAQMGNSAASRAVQQQANAADRIYTERKLAQGGKPISDALIQRYRNHQAVMDRINQTWDGAIRQVEIYRNPTSGENSELPSGYSAAWVNKNGDYMVSGSANYDPNSASNGGWTRLEKVSQ